MQQSLSYENMRGQMSDAQMAATLREAAEFLEEFESAADVDMAKLREIHFELSKIQRQLGRERSTSPPPIRQNSQSR